MAVGEDDDVIEEAVVSIGPSVEKTFRKQLEAQLKKATAGLDAVTKVRLVADGTGFNRSARAELKKQAALGNVPTYKVKLVADSTGFNASARAALASQAGRLRQSEGAVQRSAQAGANARERAERAATATADRESQRRTRIAEQESRRSRAALSKQFGGPKIIDFGGEGIRPMNALIGAAVALSPALIGVASSAVQASTSIAALGSAAIGTGLLVAGLTIAFSGLTKLLALRTSVKAQQAQEAANSAATAASNADAELRNRNNLIDAAHAELQAEKDLHAARKEAARDLANLKQKVADLQEQERSDKLTLAEAKDKNAAVQRSFFASALEKARSNQDVRDARTKLADTSLDRSQARTDLTESVSKGVSRADKVTQAQERVRQARARAAEARLTSASAGTTTAAKKATSAQANLDAQLKKASPALREMYYWIDKNQGRFEDWTRQIQQAFLPGFNTLLKEISAPARKGQPSTIQFFVDQMDQLGGIVSKYAGRFGKFTNTPFFREKFGTIGDNNAKSLENLGHAAETLERPLLRIFEKASPLLVKFTGELDDFAVWFDQIIKKADDSGALATWFKDAGVELDKWIGIGKNLLGVLGDIFTASLPSGKSMVDRLLAFTGEISKWTSSAHGQQKMKEFFDFFKKVDYGKVALFFTRAAELFLAFRTAKWALANPFFTAIGLFAASNPAAASAFMGTLATSLTNVLGFMTDHPVAVTSLLGILAAAKLGKTFGLNLKLPALDSLGAKLTSRFAILDKVFGGGASTGTMVVKAAVVNVYGGAGLGSAVPGKGGAPGKAGAVGLGPGPGLTAAAVLAYLFGKEGFDRGKAGKAADQDIKDFLANPTWGNFAKSLGTFSPAQWAGYIAGKLAHDPTKAEDEAKAFKKVGHDAATYWGGFTGTDKMNHPANDPSVLNRDAIKDYIDKRKKSVDVLVKETGAVRGNIAAQQEQERQDRLSAGTLATTLQTYGFTADAAKRAADEIFHIGDSTATTRLSLDQFGQYVDTATGKVQVLDGATGNLSDGLEAIIGDHKILISADGYDDTYKQLKSLYESSYVLYNPAYSNMTGGGGADTVSSQTGKVIDPSTGFPPMYMKKADGGPVPGFSPHSKADNIPAMLTADEYVQPVDAVKHYGVDFMEAIRTKRLPRYAKGGRVGRDWPVKVNVRDIPMPDPSTFMAPAGGGVASGNINVARVAEATARQMGATNKQLIALMEAGLVESGLRNLTRAVDHDSLGFLQQRPSQGWGTPSQVTNVAYATRKFIAKAMRADRGAYTAGQLAQKVQRSAFPDRYDKRYADAVAVLNLEAPGVGGLIGGGAFGGGGRHTGKIAANLGNVHNVTEAIYNAIVGAHQAYPNARVTSSYRPGAMTVSGNRSYHSRNPSRAADFSPPSMRLFDYFHSRYPAARELIYSPAGRHQLKNGQPHMYTGDVRRQHFNHVHLALAKGGLVPARKYDTGGTLPPGYTLAFNGTGRHETIRTEKQEKRLDAPMRLHRGDIALLAANIAQASNQQITMDGRAVAEVTNKYTYMPAGV